MSLFKSVATFGGFTLLSRITGFVRDMFIATYLGAGVVSDAFFVAFRLPNLFRNLFAEGAFASAFVPMLSHKLASDGKQSAFEFAAKAICVLSVFVTLLVIVIEIFMPALVHILAPGFIGDPQKTELATTLSRITFPFLLFISIVSFQSGILNSLGKFGGPGSVQIIMNLTMVAAVVIFVPFGADAADSLALAITVSGVLQILYLQYFLRKEDVKLRFNFSFKDTLHNQDIKTLFKRLTPGILGAGVYQINMMIDLILVSLVGTGAISWIYYANRLNQLPLGVVGAAIGVVLLPVLSQDIKCNRSEDAQKNQDKALEYAALLAIPASVVLMFLAVPIINILFQHGKFGSLETAKTATALIAYSFGLPFYVFAKAFAPNFFARGDTKTPVKYSIIILGSNTLFSLLLMIPFGHVGIAAASTLSGFVSVYIYVHGLKKRGFWECSAELKRKFGKIVLVSAIMGIFLMTGSNLLNAAYGNWLDLSLVYKVILLSILCGAGAIVFALFAKVFGVLDFAELLKIFKHRKTKPCPTVK